MVPLPKPFSIMATRIESAIIEGRAEDILHELVAALRTGKASSATQILAARWIETVGLRPGDAKALRSGSRALPKEWQAISEMVEQRQFGGETYASAVQHAAQHFGYSERHIQTCVAAKNAATAQE